MLSPREVGKLLYALRPRPGERALAIAAPYAAMVLQRIGLDVTRLDGDNLTDVSGTWPVIVCEGAVTRAPASWLAALAPEGRLAVVERDGPTGRAMLYLKTEQSTGARPLFDCAPPVMAGFAEAPGFVF
jgi:protein-L-isoaspartate(D-aspartate) O-methyltransferase